MDALTRRCKTCGDTKPLESFPVQKGCKDGRRASCKVCAAAKSKRWREADPARAKASVAAVKARDPERWRELDRARSSRYRANNPETKRESARKYARSNKDKTKAWYRANSDKVRERVKRWAEANPDKVRVNALASVNRRRARKGNATPAWADHDKIKALYRKRDRLQKLTGLKFHVDHEIPLTNDKVCGLHVHPNLRVVLEKVNRSEGNRFEHG